MIDALVTSFNGSSLGAYGMLNKQMERFRDIFAAQPEVQREVEHFRAKIGTVKSTKDLLDDPRLLTFSLTAFRLEDKAFAKAFVGKLLDEGADDAEDLARKLTDPRFAAFTNAFAFNSKGTANLTDPAWVEKMVGQYIQQRFENEAGNGNPAVQKALSFARKAPTVSSWYQILGDRDLYEVARQAAGIPASASKLDIDKQVELFESKMKLTDLKDAAKVDKLISSYLIRHDAESGAAQVSSPAVALLSNSAPLTGFAPIVSIDPTLFLKT